MTTKPPSQRYTALKKVGSGDFATTFSARDTRLNRDVAIKQLHPQYLDDESRLARYWREAQMLASLEHPNNMTIYDVDRAKGRLVLELMQGSLRQVYSGRPMPVEDVRQTLIQGLKGLQCLHDNGIVHGDINPNNLFLSRQDVVKLGDFGLARRVEDDEGSLLKGTTRYIAPEIVSEEFGKVGPASDLYSLGFSALDLLVGSEFESLFPDLIAFGRDRKMAWMMWHCSADRKLPPVQSMLEGVPDDLANVIARLTAKDQSKRYKTANDALQDLSANPVPVGRSLKEEAAAAAKLAWQKRKKRRILAVVACVASVLLSGAIYWSTLPPPPAPERVAPPPIVGVVQNVLPIDNKLVLDLGTDWKEIKLAGVDTVTLNRKQRQLRDLELDDRVTVHTIHDPDNKFHYEIIAFRPETHAGVIEGVDLEKNTIVLKVSEGEDANAGFTLLVPENTPVALNKLPTEKGEPLTVASLVAGDRVVVRHSDDEAGMLALSIDALREVDLVGYVRHLEMQKRIITVALTEGDEHEASFVRIPLGPECAFTLNELTSLNNKLVGLGDLKPGDRVTVRHDAKATRIAAYRVFSHTGRIKKIDYERGSLEVTQEGSGLVNWAVDGGCSISLGDRPVSLDDLRAGDLIEVAHDTPGEAVPVLDRIEAIRPPDKDKWAILIGIQTFEDPGISPLTSPVENVRALRTVLTGRYAVPDDQAFVCEDFDRVRLEQEIPAWLSRVPPGAELYVYLGTRALRVGQNNVFLATRDTVLERINETSLKLEWLIDWLDNCPANKKVLFLDCTHDGKAGESKPLSPAEMLEMVRATRRGGYPRSLYVFGSCQEGQVSATLPADTKPGLFAATIASGFAGGADGPRDNRIEITELAEYVERMMKSASRSSGIEQVPVMFLPDSKPPRISEAAKGAILALLAHFEDNKLDRDDIFVEAAAATKLAGGQPDADLALGIVLINHARMSQALEVLEPLRLKHPGLLMAHRAVIWLHFQKSQHDAGLAKLQIMLNQIPETGKSGGEYDAEILGVFESAGRFRELAGTADWTQKIPTPAELEAYDQLIAGFGDQAIASHTLGREKVRSIMAGYDEQIRSNPGGEASLDRQRFRNYIEPIADQATVASIRLQLDR